MIICPNCNYQNPEGASQCEACYTPLPALITCSNCGATVQADASFCGQCGHSLANQSPVPASPPLEETPVPLASTPVEVVSSEAMPLVEPEPLVVLEPLPDGPPPLPDGPPPLPDGPPPLPDGPPPPLPVDPAPANIPTAVDIYSEPQVPQPELDILAPQTQIQSLSARLLHVQTDTVMELPTGLEVLHMGKPNDRIPPDLDVSGFPESEIVSRVHANIRIEGDVYYIEDVGSSNGTYINNLPLAAGNRHRLRPGDRIALGKGDKVSFIFQLA